MVFGLESILLRPPWAALISILLILGVDRLGLLVGSWFGLGRAASPTWHRWQAPVIGAMALTTVLYPLVLIGATPRWGLQIVATVLAIVGGVHLIRLLAFLPFTRLSNGQSTLRLITDLRAWRLPFWLLLGGMGLLALGPVTNADSLDYHVGVPIAILNRGGMPLTPEWFHSRLAGNGEVLIALGLSVGAEQFGALLQFSGLLAVAGLLVHSEHPGELARGATSQSRMLATVALSAPVLLFLVSAPKPQLLPIAMTTLGLALTVYPSRRQLDRRDAVLGFVLICLLLMTASQAKLNFLLSAGIVGLVGLIGMARYRLLWQAAGIIAAVAVVVIAPPVMWKYLHYGGGLTDVLLTPFPGDWPGTDAFESTLRRYRDNSMPFPVSLLLPSSLGKLTTVLGAGLVLMLWLRPKRDPWLWLTIGAAVAVALFGSLLGQWSARFFLEPFFWLLMSLAMMPSVGADNFAWTATRWLISAQVILTLCLVGFGIVTLLPGAVSPAWRSAVMTRSAYGYTVMAWADDVLPPDAVLLSSHRSMGLAPREAVSMDWFAYAGRNLDENNPYLQRLKEREVSHILVFGSPENVGIFRNCVGDVIAGPQTVRRATRNPLNVGGLYNAYILAFHHDELPDCVLSK